MPAARQQVLLALIFFASYHLVSCTLAHTAKKGYSMAIDALSDALRHTIEEAKKIE